MSEMKIDQLEFRGNDGGVCQGELHTALLTTADRIRRTARGVGITLGLGVLAVFIPVFHWVLVPLFLVALPVVGVYMYRVTAMVERAVGECPACRQPITLTLAPQTRIPHWGYCPTCNRPLQLVYHTAPVGQ
jgi:hypothetical protein